MLQGFNALVSPPFEGGVAGAQDYLSIQKQIPDRVVVRIILNLFPFGILDFKMFQG